VKYNEKCYISDLSLNENEKHWSFRLSFFFKSLGIVGRGLIEDIPVYLN